MPNRNIEFVVPTGGAANGRAEARTLVKLNRIGETDDWVARVFTAGSYSAAYSATFICPAGAHELDVLRVGLRATLPEHSVGVVE